MDNGAISPPANTPPYMWPAWASCLNWALGNDDAVAAFRADTGIEWRPGMTPVDRLIDHATGADRQFIVAFVNWFNVEIWGDPMADEP